MYNEGISASGSVVDLGLEHKVLEKRGAWISYNGDLIGQGRDAAKAEIRDKPELAKEIMDKILANVKAAAEAPKKDAAKKA